MVGHPGQTFVKPRRRFFKLSGSGNDFVFFDVSKDPAEKLEAAGAIQAVCARGTGVGADGVVFLRAEGGDQLTMRYYNSDGSLGELCGNATLCAVRLATETGMVSSDSVRINTDAGVIRARMADGHPEIDLAPVREVVAQVPGIPRLHRERFLGFARAGVPHVVILDSDVESADILGRGSLIRRDPSLRDGANVDFLSADGDDWKIRTYERGVEGETLACGTGAVAAGILLTEWGRALGPVGLRTRSGRRLEVRVKRDGSSWLASLRGPAEIVFEGELMDLEI